MKIRNDFSQLKISSFKPIAKDTKFSTGIYLMTDKHFKENGNKALVLLIQVFTSREMLPMKSLCACRGKFRNQNFIQTLFT